VIVCLFKPSGGHREWSGGPHSGRGPCVWPLWHRGTRWNRACGTLQHGQKRLAGERRWPDGGLINLAEPGRTARRRSSGGDQCGLGPETFRFKFICIFLIFLYLCREYFDPEFHNKHAVWYYTRGKSTFYTARSLVSFFSLFLGHKNTHTPPKIK